MSCHIGPIFSLVKVGQANISNSLISGTVVAPPPVPRGPPEMSNGMYGQHELVAAISQITVDQSGAHVSGATQQQQAQQVCIFSHQLLNFVLLPSSDEFLSLLNSTRQAKLRNFCLVHNTNEFF